MCSGSRAPDAGRLNRVPTLYTAERCPYAARARVVLAEKGLDYDAVEIDLDDRPAWLYEKNPLGRVPVYEEDGGLVLPESRVIMEYLEERYPEPPLWPADPAERALGRLWLERFDDRLGRAYYAARRGDGREELDARLAELDLVLGAQPYLSGREYGLADIGYEPWILRALKRFGLELGPSLADWLERVASRPAVAAERELVAGL
jgi:glutathione S-transferase